jgi:hypothetical protein
MYWSGYDTSILLTGILTIVLAMIPGIGVAPKSRLAIGAVGAGLVIISIITGNAQSLVYPSGLSIAPALPVAAGIIMIVRARRAIPRDEQAFENRVAARVAGAVPPATHAAKARDTPNASDSDLVSARDPNTPLALLADLAYDRPDLREAIAENPSTYPDLLHWLAELDSPAVTEALSRRATGN